MLVFCDESWKTGDDGVRIGTLAAVAIPRTDYNDVEDRVFHITEKYLGSETARNREIKGKLLLSPYEFRRVAQEKGVVSMKLSCARELLEELKMRECKAFAIVVSSEAEVDLLCENDGRLDRPYAFLMERVQGYVAELPSGVRATFCFDDRGLGKNADVGRAFRNFLSRSQMGRSFSRIIRSPAFAYSHLSAGVQMADLLCTVVNRYHTDRVTNPAIKDYYRIAQGMEWAQSTVSKSGYPMRGFRVLRDRPTNEKKRGVPPEQGRT